jgi:Ca2+-binding RTX toxin-like protein
VTGGDGGDTLDGASLSNNITLNGEGGDDTLIGGHGNDFMLGGAGDDVMNGNAGDDLLIGGAGHNTLLGGDGNDSFVFNAGETPADNTLDGGDGIDTIFLQSGAGDMRTLFMSDTMRTNIERISAGAGNDYIDARELRSGIEMHGNDGSDFLAGSEGDDILFGDEGHDYLLGRGGHDTLFGGAGDDIFVLRAGSESVAMVADFQQGVDHIQIASTTLLDFDTVMQHALQIGGSTQIDLDGTIMVLQHIAKASLSASDFFFDVVA